MLLRGLEDIDFEGIWGGGLEEFTLRHRNVQSFVGLGFTAALLTRPVDIGKGTDYSLGEI